MRKLLNYEQAQNVMKNISESQHKVIHVIRGLEIHPTFC